MGRIVFNAPKDDSGKPDARLATIIEEAKSESILNGYENALLYARGITSRSPFEGGKRERELAAKYRAISCAFAGTHANFSEMYSRIAHVYESQAKQEDLEAERERLGR